MKNLQGLSELKTVFSLGILSALITFLFYRKKFFCLSHTQELTIHIKGAFLGFLLYLFTQFFFPPLLYPLLLSLFKEVSPLVLMTSVQFGSILLLIAFLYAFSLLQGRETSKAIWFGQQTLSPSFFRKNLSIGAFTWFLCFPISLFWGKLAELTCYFFWNILPKEQVAVHFLRKVFKSPSLTPLALFSILIAAPIIEEWVFRGYIQTYFKQKWGYARALLISSTAFSLSHLSFSQGLSSIPMLVSLFSLALFLGFLYEKQGSLIAPVALHITFNSISVVRILF